jgi:hypothetical protein
MLYPPLRIALHGDIDRRGRHLAATMVEDDCPTRMPSLVKGEVPSLIHPSFHPNQFHGS